MSDEEKISPDHLTLLELIKLYGYHNKCLGYYMAKSNGNCEFDEKKYGDLSDEEYFPEKSDDPDCAFWDRLAYNKVYGKENANQILEKIVDRLFGLEKPKE